MVGKEHPEEWSNWEAQAEAAKLNSEPERLNEFIKNQMPPEVRSELQMYLR